uniref:Plastid movement impaired 2 n=1 Tax=Davidia involucrata TaxID=16924 RepID=A0A5B7ATV3_DAVIN
MGNSIGGGRRKAKVMKINGETFKLKTPIRVGDVVDDYPGHVLLESEAVKRFGIRAKPLEPQQELKPKKIYFLLELPNLPEEKAPCRRVRSGVHMSAKDRLECLMLSRRSVSDLGIVRPTTMSGGPGPVQVKMRLPKAQVAKLVEESRDEAEVAEKIVGLYMENAGEVSMAEAEAEAEAEASDEDEDEGLLLQRPVQYWRPGLGSIKESFKARS